MKNKTDLNEVPRKKKRWFLIFIFLREKFKKVGRTWLSHVVPAAPAFIFFT